MRINKYIAKTGFASRRKSEEYIKNGKVFVNGNKLEDLSYQVKEEDEVKIDGKILLFFDFLQIYNLDICPK